MTGEYHKVRVKIGFDRRAKNRMMRVSNKKIEKQKKNKRELIGQLIKYLILKKTVSYDTEVVVSLPLRCI